jgi:hypothetical protein
MQKVIDIIEVLTPLVLSLLFTYGLYELLKG